MNRRPDPEALAATLLRPSRRPPGARALGGNAGAIALVLVGTVVAMAALVFGFLLLPRDSLFGGVNSATRRSAGAVALLAAPLLPVLAGAIGARTSKSPVWAVLGVVFAVPVAGVAAFIAWG